MRTADTIAQQTEMQDSKKAEKRSKDGTKRGQHKNCIKNLKPYVPGVSGNPGGLPGYDVAAVLARAVLEGSQEAAYEGLSAQLAKGNAYTFKELADRGYGKLKEKHEHSMSEDMLKALEAGRKRAAAR